MQDLISQEQFELEVLNELHSRKLLSDLIFTGGTMLRLCFGLNRFSVDLDFWMTEKTNSSSLYLKIKQYLNENYSIKATKDKFNTLVFEIKSKHYPRSLKLEIRKDKGFISTEKAIAYSKFSDIQVLMKVVSLPEMMKSKIETFLDRKEIRDVFDIEFLYKKGVPLNVPLSVLEKLLTGIEKLSKIDYKTKLGSLLENTERRYYAQDNFKILKYAIKQQMNFSLSFGTTTETQKHRKNDVKAEPDQD